MGHYTGDDETDWDNQRTEWDNRRTDWDNRRIDPLRLFFGIPGTIDDLTWLTLATMTVKRDMTGRGVSAANLGGGGN